jgi:hypothetical protein
MARQAALGLVRDVGECALEAGTTIVRLLRELEFGIRIVALVLPSGRIIHQMRKGDVAATLRQKHIARAQAVADSDG